MQISNKNFMKVSDAKNVNDVIAAVAARARELADKRMDELRMEQSGEMLYGAKQSTIGMTRGELIEAILLDELDEEFPREIVY